jgi:hypothetical protein
MLRSLLVALFLALVLLGGLEGFFRQRGVPPSLADDHDLWCAERDRVAALGPGDVVLLGGSRMQLDFALDTFRERYPHRRIVQLAIDGSTPFAALADLAEHSRFAGMVLCDVHAYCNADYGAPGDVQAQYVRSYHRDWGPSRAINQRLLSQLQQRLAIANAAVGLNGLINGLRTRHFSRPAYYTRADRETAFDYTLMAVDARRQLETAWVENVERARAAYRQRGRAAWEADAERVGQLVRSIQARGGTVLFARFPTSGAVREREERLFPRAAFWDPFLQRTGASGLNYADSPALSRFKCAEGSHLDYRDTPAFTQTLWQEIEAGTAIRRSRTAGQEQPSPNSQRVAPRAREERLPSAVATEAIAVVPAKSLSEP